MEALRPDHVNVLESTFDFVTSKSMEARDLAIGLSAVVRTNPSSPLTDLIARIRAALVSVVDALEESAAIDAERKRNHAQAGKHVGMEVRR